jgi:malate/lactate dehydrogenase
MIRILLWAPLGAGTHYWGPGTSAFRLYKSNTNKNVKVTLVSASYKQDKFPDVYDEQISLPSLDNNNLISKIKYMIAAKKWKKKLS